METSLFSWSDRFRDRDNNLVFENIVLNKRLGNLKEGMRFDYGVIDFEAGTLEITNETFLAGRFTLSLSVID
jgi:hypothetical protein